LLELSEGWAPAFRQRRTWARAIVLALGLLCGWGRRRALAGLPHAAIGRCRLD
jgi:hypothetical protein